MSTAVEHSHEYGFETGAPNRRPTEICKESSYNTLPKHAAGKAVRPASDSLDVITRRRALSFMLLTSSELAKLFSTISWSPNFWRPRSSTIGNSTLHMLSHLFSSVACKQVVHVKFCNHQGRQTFGGKERGQKSRRAPLRRVFWTYLSG